MRQMISTLKALGLGVLMMALSGAMALAQEGVPSEEPYREPVTVGVFGDSLADGLWAGLYWHLRNDPNIDEVLQFSEVSTGITNWTYVDVAEKTQEQLAEHDIDIAIFMFGGNDIQGIAQDGAVYNFRSEGWQEIYRERIDILAGLLKDHGAQIAWVGLPRMRSVRYDNNTIFLNSLFEDRALAGAYPFIETRPATMDEAGEYNAYLPDRSGTPRLVRADDGIHFTLRGYRVMAASAAQWARDQAHSLRYSPPVVEEESAQSSGLLDQLSIVIEGQAYQCRAIENPLEGLR